MNEINKELLTKVWDRYNDKKLPIVTGTRAVYQSKVSGICETCHTNSTNRVVDYLGRLQCLQYDCGCQGLLREDSRSEEEEEKEELAWKTHDWD